MEAPGPPAVRARSRRGGPSAPQRHARGAGRGCRPAPPSRGGGRSSAALQRPRDAGGEGTRSALAARALPHGSLCRDSDEQCGGAEGFFWDMWGYCGTWAWSAALQPHLSESFEGIWSWRRALTLLSRSYRPKPMIQPKVLNLISHFDILHRIFSVAYGNRDSFLYIVLHSFYSGVMHP